MLDPVHAGTKKKKFPYIFLIIDNGNCIKRQIEKIGLGDKSVISHGKLIMRELEKYFAELCRKRHVKGYSTNWQGVTEGKINTLEDADREDLEGYISYKVLTQVVKKMQNNKRPGSDGFPVEFYSLLELL